LVDENGKILSCPFDNIVLCSYRKDPKFTVMDRCLKCSHYEQFAKEMDEEEDKFFEEVEEAHRTGVWK